MAALVAARDMILSALQVTGTESIDPANAFVTPDEALAVLNGELAETYDTILENGVGDYFRSEVPLTLSAGVSRYSLQADFYEIVGVDVVWSSDITRSAKLFMESERNRFRRILPAWSQLCDIWYRPLAAQIEFMPVPLVPVNVTVLYIPTFTPLTDEDKTFDSVNQWHWMAIWGVAAYIAAKDDDKAGAQQFLQRKDSVKARIVSMAGRRIEGEPPRVQRSRRYDDEDSF